MGLMEYFRPDVATRQLAAEMIFSVLEGDRKRVDSRLAHTGTCYRDYCYEPRLSPSIDK